MKSKSYDLGDATLHAGDCVAILPTLGPVDAIVTDPPYHLAPHVIGQMQQGRDGAYKRLNRGFMGQTWDGGDIAFRPETWAAIGAPLKPGGYLLAFGGSRTHHRIWCAIEDAGFVIQDTVMWLYGQGFPKGRTQLKPAHEPICVAYKPGGKRVLNIDECRVPTNGEDMGDPSRFDGQKKNASAGWVRSHHFNDQLMADRQAIAISRAQLTGRWPANVCHDGSDEVMEAFAAFGKSKSSRALISKPMKRQDNQVYGKGLGSIGPANTFSDAGTAARFFKACPSADDELLGGADRFHYCAKASKADRAGSKHPTVKPIALMRWLVRLVTPPNGTVLDPFAGSGTTGAAAIAEGRNAILIEREPEYIEDIRRRLKPHKAAA